MTLSTSSSSLRLLWALAVALAIWLGLNAWVGWRLPVLLEDTAVADLEVLDRRVKAFPDPAGVRVLVLGNSNAQAGLRPPLLAEALALPPDAVFSLALPRASVQEQALLWERYREMFPGAVLAIVAVDEFLLTAQAELRLRHLTRFSPVDRWRVAGPYPDLDRRLSLWASLFFPLVDFKEVVWTTDAVGRLVSGEAPPENRLVRLDRMTYRWGYPPTWDYEPPQKIQAFMAYQQQARQIIQRTTSLLGGAHGLDERLDQLEALVSSLERAGVRVTLVTTPYQARAVDVQRRLLRKPYQAYLEAIRGYEVRSGRSLVRPEGVWPQRLFYDANHLNAAGARAYAAYLAGRLAGEMP